MAKPKSYPTAAAQPVQPAAKTPHVRAGNIYAPQRAATFPDRKKVESKTACRRPYRDE